MTLEEARNNKSIKYDGKPCKNCGETEKYTKNRSCIKCHNLNFNYNIYYPKKREHICKLRRKNYNNASIEIIKNRQKDQRRNHLKRKYNLTEKEYEEMVKNQNGRCEICKKFPNSGRYKRLVVDHDHKTNINRDLLCDTCNRVIGFLNEDFDYIDKIINYLNKHNPIRLVA